MPIRTVETVSRTAVVIDPADSVGHNRNCSALGVEIHSTCGAPVRGYAVCLRPDGTWSLVVGPWGLLQAERAVAAAWLNGDFRWRVLPEHATYPMPPLRGFLEVQL